MAKKESSPQSLPKDGGLVPDRRHFDPLAIRRLMPMMVMVEYDRIETATFRYAAQNSLSSAAGGADVYITYPDTLARMTTNGHRLGVLAGDRSNEQRRRARQQRVAIDDGAGVLVADAQLRRRATEHRW